MVGALLKVHTLASLHIHDDQFTNGGSHGVLQVNSRSLIGHRFFPIICRFFGT